MKSGYKSSFAIAALLFGAPTVMADMTYIGDACRECISSYTLDCGLLEYYPCRCTSNIFSSSTIKCMYSQMNDEAAIRESLDVWIGYCEEYGNVTVTYEELMASYEADVAANNFTNVADLANITAPLTTPVIFTDSEILSNIKTVKTYNWEVYSGTLFG